MNPVVVIDNGSCCCRVGIGGDDAPRGVFQNAIAKFKGDNRVFVGREIDESRVINRMLLRRPFDRGYIVNWGLEQSIWARMLDRFIPEVQLSDASLIMTEPILNLASIQTITQEIVFEHFGFHEMHAAPAPELAMHAFAHANPDDPVAQSLSGVVIDAGYSFTHAVPIFDGRAIKDATRRIRVGGRLLTNLMKEWVSYRSMNLKDEPYLVEQIKDQVCYVADCAEVEMKRAFPKPKSQVSMEFVLPDGVHNERGFVQNPRDPAVIDAKRERQMTGVAAPPLLHVNSERFMVPEALLRPGDVGLPQVGITEVAAQALHASHAALRPLLSTNFVLAGGCSACPGMQPRVARDLRPLVDDFYDVRVSVPEDPAASAWRGGSAVAVNGWYKGIMVSKAEYDECGAGKMHRAAMLPR